PRPEQYSSVDGVVGGGVAPPSHCFLRGPSPPYDVTPSPQPSPPGIDIASSRGSLPPRPAHPADRAPSTTTTIRLPAATSGVSMERPPHPVAVPGEASQARQFAEPLARVDALQVRQRHRFVLAQPADQ